MEERFSSGLQDVRATMERSQTLLEAKVEYVFAGQNKNFEKESTAMQTQLEEVAEHLFKRSSETYDANSSSVQTIHKTLSGVATKLDEYQISQEKMAAEFSTSISKISEGWAHQMIQ